MKEINKFVKTAEQSGIRHVSDFISDTTNLIQLTVGEIDLPTPEKTKQAGIKAIENNYTKYTSNLGALETRKAIIDFAKKHYGINYDYNTEVIVTVGVSEGIDLALRTLCNIGDEVIIPSPAYPAYITSTTITGAKPVFVDTAKTNFKITADDLERAITEKTKAVILNYPNNPTGTILSESDLNALATVIKRHDLYVLTDDVYDLLVYDNLKQAPSIVTIPGMKERTIVLNGLSKSHSMTGWRVGYLLANKDLITEMFKVHQTNVGTVTSISQAAAVTALTLDNDNPQKFVEIFEKRRNFIIGCLDKMGAEYVQPKGAFYVFVSIKNFGVSSWDFSLWLLKKYKLAVVPGSAFSKHAEGYVRISYAANTKILKAAMERLKRAFNEFQIKK
ncbi:MAG: aminotransferase class I/II-fold pyridoxal phosphate-dependent enzyme [Liquorilactobacillus ghanensis]|uniref:pyridoxal phosphate-dependent aminotransferase n=1 Tax=Liquorilactobacillus ghanensis TaxID=399370 RepID=UPI0039E77575